MRVAKVLPYACLCALMLAGIFSFVHPFVAHAATSATCPSGQTEVASGNIVIPAPTNAVIGKAFLCKDSSGQFAAYSVANGSFGTTFDIDATLTDVGLGKNLGIADADQQTSIETGFFPVAAGSTIRACGVIDTGIGGSLTGIGCTPNVTV